MTQEPDLKQKEKVCVHCGYYVEDKILCIDNGCNHDYYPARCTYCYFRFKRGERLYL